MVTGASSGIGLESARKFAASGAIVILVARTLSAAGTGGYHQQAGRRGIRLFL